MKTYPLIFMKNFYAIIRLLPLCVLVLALGLPQAYAHTETTAQQTTVRGKVSSDADGPLSGVSVREKGTNNAVSTNASGDFEIRVTNNASVLVFTSMGFETTEVTVGTQRTINLTLFPSSQEIEGVVVTALGITRAKRALGYSVEEVTAEEFVRVPQENILNAMSGKIAGVTINQTGGVGSSVSMVIRGATSLSSDNQPLFVIDGVPVSNTVNNVTNIGDRNNVDYGNAISSLNPDDIESVTVLKGPNAAALYGSRAGNGVVLITTKSGRNADRVSISITSNTVIDRPYSFLDFQSKFGSGAFSAIPTEISGSLFSNPFGQLVQENTGGSFGAELDKGYMAVQWNSPIGEDGRPIPTPLVSYPNNIQNFIQNGVTSTNSISVANGNERMNYRLSYSNMAHRGMIPNTDLKRNTLNLNGGLNITDNIRISSMVDISRNNADNRPSGDRGTNPLEAAYMLSPHINILDMQDYWMAGQEGLQQRSHYPAGFDNPYFLANEVSNGFFRDRLYGNVRADWSIIPGLDLMVRYGLDTYKEQRETKLPMSYTREQRGGYGIVNLNRFESNADFLLSYNTEVQDFTIGVSGGGNFRFQKNTDIVNKSRNGSQGLILPGVYTLQNILATDLDYSSFLMRRGVHSAYGMANLGYRDMLFLDLTGRTDWSSTLPNASPYFYPSASLSMIVNEMVGLNSPNVDLIKLRGGYAEVGNDAGAYLLMNTLSNASVWGNVPRFGIPGTRLIPDLKPEFARSYEGGLDLNFFQNTLRFSGTWYMVDNENQIFPTTRAASSGVTNANINAGKLRSKGYELTLGVTPVRSTDWNWDVNMNFTRNRTRILELTDDMPFYRFWGTSGAGAWTYVGEEVGDIYGAELVTVNHPNYPQYQGYPLLDNTGKWVAIDAEETRNKIGNFNPNFIMGGQTSVSYKNWTLQMALDWRNGGDFFSETFRRGEEEARSNRFLDKLFNRGLMSDKEVRDYLVANQDGMIRVIGNDFPLVGGPTPEYGSYPFVFPPYTLPYGGVFVPGIRQIGVDGAGDPVYVENLGEKINEADGTLILPFAGATTWSFPQAFVFPSDYLKLREISLTYAIPQHLVNRWNMQNMSVSVYSRNIILWTKAKIGVDPENAYKPSGNGFLQGVEQYNINPWVMPIGFRLQVTF